MILPKDLLRDVKHVDKKGVRERVREALNRMDQIGIHRPQFSGPGAASVFPSGMSTVTSVAYWPATGTILSY